MAPIHKDHPIRTYFAGVVENAFCAEAGVCDPQLTDYLSRLLVEFTHIDQLSTLHHALGRNFDEMAHMLAITCETPANSSIDRERTVYRNMGDFSLFWTGLYPEQVARELSTASAGLSKLIDHGKRSYAIVSELSDDQHEPPSRLFRLMSLEFEYCVYGLGLVRRVLEQSKGNHDHLGGVVLL